MNLEHLGWNNFFAEAFRHHRQAGLVPARIVREDRLWYQAYGEGVELVVEIPGKMRRSEKDKSSLPSVGDWVAVELLPEPGKGVVRAVLPRQTCFARRVTAPGGRDGRRTHTKEQVLATNIDLAFLISGLDGGRNMNVQRIERYLALARDCGTAPVIILNKADACPDVPGIVAAVNKHADGTPVHAISALNRTGIEQIETYLEPGRTIALIGTSGVGKSTLINTLAGCEKAYVAEVRASDRRGRHTTAWRELIILPNHALMIDTPGIKDLQMWTDKTQPREAFSDIEAMADHCRFGDCRHGDEPGCAIRAAIKEGVLEESRLGSYLKLANELQTLGSQRQQRVRLDQEAERRWAEHRAGRVLRRRRKRTRIDLNDQEIDDEDLSV